MEIGWINWGRSGSWKGRRDGEMEVDREIVKHWKSRTGVKKKLEGGLALKEQPGDSECAPTRESYLNRWEEVNVRDEIWR
jgi:hypothetical protein